MCHRVLIYRWLYNVEAVMSWRLARGTDTRGIRWWGTSREPKSMLLPNNHLLSDVASRDDTATQADHPGPSDISQARTSCPTNDSSEGERSAKQESSPFKVGRF